MSRRFPDFTAGPIDVHSRSKCENRYCRVHRYYDNDFQEWADLPNEWRFYSSTRGWVHARVYVGPPAWLPKRPDYAQRVDMNRHCPHEQADLSCNYCLRHVFHPYEV